MKNIRKLPFLVKSLIIASCARLVGLHFFKADSPEEIDAMQHLRWIVYAHEGYIEPSLYPDERLRDQYDPYSVNFLITDGRKPVGTLRLVGDSSLGYPTENLFNIERLSNRHSTMEIARLCVLPEYRSKGKLRSRIVMYCLAWTMYQWSRKHGIRYWLANMPEKLADSFRAFGANPVKLPEGQLTEDNIKARKIVAGYFAKRTLFPYLIAVDEVR